MVGMIWIVLLVAFLVLQVTIIPLMAGNVVRPDLLLIVTISSG